MSRTGLVVLVLSWILVGAAVSYYANDGFWFALAVAVVLIVGLAG